MTINVLPIPYTFNKQPIAAFPLINAEKITYEEREKLGRELAAFLYMHAASSFVDGMLQYFKDQEYSL